MTGTGRVAVGESAASKKYRMTMAEKKPPAPPNNRNQEAFPLELPERPKPPRPPMAKPSPPRKMREWEDHGWMWKLGRHMHLYNHRRAARKHERAEQEKRDYARDMARFKEDEERFRRENSAYLEAEQQSRKIMVHPPEPEGPAPEALTEHEKAAQGMREQIVAVGIRREEQFNFTMVASKLCQDTYSKAMELLMVPGQEPGAALLAMNFIAARADLGRAKDKYMFLVKQESTLVNQLEMFADAAFNLAVTRNQTTVAEKIREDLDEATELKKELNGLSLPDSVLEQTNKVNEDLATVLAEMQEKLKNKTREDLEMDRPQRQPVQMESATAMFAV